MHADSMMRSEGVSIGRVAAIALAGLVEALLILGFVAASLGLGHESVTGVGPDRPAPPVTIQ